MAYFEPEIGRISKSKRRSRKEENMRNVFKPKVGNKAMLRVRLLWKNQVAQSDVRIKFYKVDQIDARVKLLGIQRLAKGLNFPKLTNANLRRRPVHLRRSNLALFSLTSFPPTEFFFAFFQMLPFSATPAFFLKKSFPYFCATGVTYQQPADAFLAKLIR